MDINLRRRRQQQVYNYLLWKKFEDHFSEWELPVLNLLRNIQNLPVFVLPLIESIIAAQSILYQPREERDVYRYKKLFLSIHLQILNIVSK